VARDVADVKAAMEATGATEGFLNSADDLGGVPVVVGLDAPTNAGARSSLKAYCTVVAR